MKTGRKSCRLRWRSDGRANRNVAIVFSQAEVRNTLFSISINPRKSVVLSRNLTAAQFAGVRGESGAKGSQPKELVSIGLGEPLLQCAKD
jgi:hypothetical protein